MLDDPKQDQEPERPYSAGKGPKGLANIPK